jgi:MFS transporter, OPA family, sugar phosphate sensor protein UhpC
VVSGFLIDNNHHTSLNGVETYDFSSAKFFWLGAAVLSTICVLFVWNAKAKD